MKMHLSVMAARNYSRGQTLWSFQAGHITTTDDLKTLCWPLLPASFPPSLLPELTPCSWSCSPSGGGANEQWNGQRAGSRGEQGKQSKKGTRGWSIYKLNNQSPMVELVVAIKVFVFYNHQCLTAISCGQNVPVRYLNTRKCMGKLSNLPKGIQLIKCRGTSST